MGLLSWLWSEDALKQAQEVERQAPTFEQRLERIVETSCGLSSRTQEERQSLVEDINEALDILEAAIGVLEATAVTAKAKKTRTRLKTIRTRAGQAA